MRIVWIVQGHRSGARKHGVVVGRRIDDAVLLSDRPLGIDHDRPYIEDSDGIVHATASLDAAVRDLAPDVVVLYANSEQVLSEARRIQEHTPTVLRIGINSLESVLAGIEHAAALPSAVRFVQACHHVIVSTQEARQSLRSYGLERDRFSVVPNALSMAEERVGEPDGSPSRTVGQLSVQLSPLKNQHTLIKAIGHLRADESTRRVDAVITGRINEYGEMFRQQVAQTGLDDRVGFVGYLDDPEASFWPEVGVHVCPSFSETQPNVVLEAARAGVPSLVADAGWAEAFPDSFPRRPPDDPSAWGAAIGEYLNDDELRARTAESQQAFVRENHSLAAVVPQYVEVLERVVDRVDPFTIDGGCIA